MKKSIIVILISCVITALFACGKNSAGDSAPPGGGDKQPSAAQGGGDGRQPSGPVSAKDTVIMAITQENATLDPLHLNGCESLQAMRLVYEPLWEYDESYENIKWVLAKSIDRADPLKWVVTLRDDAYFENGNKFTAGDVLFSLNLANSRAGEPPCIPAMDSEKSKAIDENTVEICFTEPQPDLMRSFAAVFMYDGESYDPATVAEEPVGTGPYAVIDYDSGSYIKLTRRENCRGQPPPIKNVVFLLLADDSMKAEALRSGEADIARIPVGDVETIQKSTYLEVVDGAGETGADTQTALVANSNLVINRISGGWIDWVTLFWAA